MRTAHFFSLPLIAGATLIVGAALSAPVAPDGAGNPSGGSIRDGRPQGRGERRLAHAVPAITPVQVKAVAVTGFERTAAAAYNGTDKAYLVVWQGGGVVDDEVEIFGQRLASTLCDCNDPDAITGTAGLNLLVGTPGDDILCGFEGGDLLLGLRGDDCIDGGAGSDLIFGGAGADTLDGGEGLDRIFGGGGTDACRSGEQAFRCDP